MSFVDVLCTGVLNGDTNASARDCGARAHYSSVSHRLDRRLDFLPIRTAIYYERKLPRFLRSGNLHCKIGSSTRLIPDWAQQIWADRAINTLQAGWGYWHSSAIPSDAPTAFGQNVRQFFLCASVISASMRARTRRGSGTSKINTEYSSLSKFFCMGVQC